MSALQSVKKVLEYFSKSDLDYIDQDLLYYNNSKYEISSEEFKEFSEYLLEKYKSLVIESYSITLPISYNNNYFILKVLFGQGSCYILQKSDYSENSIDLSHFSEIL